MRPGHELDLKLIAVKGIGSDHAKFSPVGEYKQYFNTVSFLINIFQLLASIDYYQKFF